MTCGRQLSGRSLLIVDVGQRSSQLETAPPMAEQEPRFVSISRRQDKYALRSYVTERAPGGNISALKGISTRVLELLIARLSLCRKCTDRQARIHATSGRVAYATDPHPTTLK